MMAEHSKVLRRDDDATDLGAFEKGVRDGECVQSTGKRRGRERAMKGCHPCAKRRKWLGALSPESALRARKKPSRVRIQRTCDPFSPADWFVHVIWQSIYTPEEACPFRQPRWMKKARHILRIHLLSATPLLQKYLSAPPYFDASIHVLLAFYYLLTEHQL
jgi:hypothetical protein